MPLYPRMPFSVGYFRKTVASTLRRLASAGFSPVARNGPTDSVAVNPFIRWLLGSPSSAIMCELVGQTSPALIAGPGSTVLSRQYSTNGSNLGFGEADGGDATGRDDLGRSSGLVCRGGTGGVVSGCRLRDAAAFADRCRKVGPRTSIRPSGRGLSGVLCGRP